MPIIVVATLDTKLYITPYVLLILVALIGQEGVGYTLISSVKRSGQYPTKKEHNNSHFGLVFNLLVHSSVIHRRRMGTF